MSEYTTILEHARDRFAEPELSLDGVFRRRERRRRNQRIVAGVAGLAIAIGAIFVGSSITRSGSTPAHPNPAPTAPDRLRTSILGPDGSIERDVVGLPADAMGAQLSPDGSSVVFVTRDTDIQGCGSCAEHPGIVIMHIDGTGATMVADRWVLVDTPSWSPDGTQIAFMAVGLDGNKDIYAIDTDGTHLRRLTTDPRFDAHPSWSPDGSTIIYDNAGDVPPDSADLSRTMELWSVPADGGTPTRLTHDTVGEEQPVYSPDGTTIAVSREGAGIWLLDADGTHLRRVQGVPAGSADFSPRWSPDGRELAYLTYLPNVRRPVIADPRPGVPSSLPPLKLMIVNLASHRVSSLGSITASDVNGASWFPAGDRLLFERAVRA